MTQVNEGVVTSEKTHAGVLRMKGGKPLSPIRVRRPLGLIGLLFLLFVYALLVMRIAVGDRVQQISAAEFFFYLTKVLLRHGLRRSLSIGCSDRINT